MLKGKAYKFPKYSSTPLKNNEIALTELKSNKISWSLICVKKQSVTLGIEEIQN